MRCKPNAAATAFRRIQTPIGELALVAGPLGLTEIISAPSPAALKGRLLTHYPRLAEGASEPLTIAADQVGEYFAGRRFDFSVPLDWRELTAFQVRTLQVLQTLAFAATLSYGELARLVGRPGAARAIGGVMAANPFPIIVPCHRVLGRGERMTGYSGGKGIETKQWLLAFEQAQVGGVPINSGER